MRRSYQVAEEKDSQALAEFLAQEGQFLLPMVQLIEDAELAVDDLIDVMGRAINCGSSGHWILEDRLPL